MSLELSFTWLRDPVRDVFDPLGTVQGGCSSIHCITYCTIFTSCAMKCMELCGDYALPN